MVLYTFSLYRTNYLCTIKIYFFDYDHKIVCSAIPL